MKSAPYHSCLYKARVMHHRLAPKTHKFWYNVFMFYLDLNELETISQNLCLLSLNRFNLFSFRNQDHIQLPRDHPDRSRTVREQITRYLSDKGVEIGKGRIMILTNLCTLGYQFNPVSFYYCYDENDILVCSVVEVCNTFGEMKLYFLGNGTLHAEQFKQRVKKDFYVSPFIEADASFDFRLGVPGEKVKIVINDYDTKDNLFFLSSLTGEKAALTDRNLLLFFLSFPFITLKIITMIHWQAFLLWTKQIRFFRKADNLSLQKEVFRPYKS